MAFARNGADAVVEVPKIKNVFLWFFTMIYFLDLIPTIIFRMKLKEKQRFVNHKLTEERDMAYKLDTEVLYQGTTPQGIIRNPETPAIYPASAYILDDMEDYVFADKGGRYYYNRSANPNRDELGAAVSFLE